MNYIHIKSLDKYHPGYKDRTLQWAKIYFNLVQGDPEFELIENEIDKWRYVAMICLELQAKTPLPNSDRYFKLKGFNLKKRSMSLTLQMLHNFITIDTEDSTLLYVDKDKDKDGVTDKYLTDKEVDIFSSEIQDIVQIFYSYKSKQYKNQLNGWENNIKLITDSCSVIDKLHRIDKFSHDEIKLVLENSFKDNFWKNQIVQSIYSHYF